MSLSAVLAGDTPKSKKFRLSTRTEILRKSIPLQKMDVGAFSRDCFQTIYSAENGCRVSIYDQKSINGTVEWLGTPAPFCDTGVAWPENILVPGPRWGDGGNYKTWDLQTQYGVRFGGRSVPWRGAVPFCAAFLPRSLVNTRAITRRVQDICLRENRLALVQTILHTHHTGGDEWVNQSDHDLDSWVEQ